jgi:hypothetical protein
MQAIVPFYDPPRFHQTTIDETITPSAGGLPSGWVDVVDAASGRRIFIHTETNAVVFHYDDIFKKSPAKIDKPASKQTEKPRSPRFVSPPKAARIPEPSVSEESTVQSSSSDEEVIDVSVAQLRRRVRRSGGIPSQIDVEESSDDNEDTQSVSKGVEDGEETSKQRYVEIIEDQEDNDSDEDD